MVYKNHHPFLIPTVVRNFQSFASGVWEDDFEKLHILLLCGGKVFCFQLLEIDGDIVDEHHESL